MRNMRKDELTSDIVHGCGFLLTEERLTKSHQELTLNKQTLVRLLLDFNKSKHLNDNNQLHVFQLYYACTCTLENFPLFLKAST